MTYLKHIFPLLELLNVLLKFLDLLFEPALLPLGYREQMTLCLHLFLTGAHKTLSGDDYDMHHKTFSGETIMTCITRP
ncbi:hypothetical protein DPMN_140807 [Dreissena polymorpha]|uniref:Uncharacterized protein n=1 Tax=Dreissena polymorpha TaxID=45954 RepID=A0A9D4JM22_DREPO|nr:hypothetical protein DPMN_140807 [Dreissena polymorpha]